jgi:hypothetical protein
MASRQPSLKVVSGNWYMKVLNSHVTGTQRLLSPFCQPNLSPADAEYCRARQLGAAPSATCVRKGARAGACVRQAPAGGSRR